MARECSVERKVVENYFSILEDLLIGYRVPVFTKKAKRRLISHPKFYFFDVGIYRTLRPMGPLDMPEEAEGAAFETLLFQELNTLNSVLETSYDIYCWRTSNKVEVDFVLYGKNGLLAFEVKKTGRISKSMFSGLKAFLKDYPMARAFFVYGGKRLLREDDIEIIPLDMLLQELPGILVKEQRE